MVERAQRCAHRSGHVAHQDQAQHSRPEEAVPLAGRGPLQLPDQGHAHDRPGQNDEQERFLFLCRPLESDCGGGRLGATAVRKTGGRNAGGLYLHGRRICQGTVWDKRD